MTSAAAPKPTPAAPGPAATAATTAIPFRESSPVAGPDLLWSMFATVLLLALFAAAAWQAHRRGWLNRWISKPVVSDAPQEGLRVLERLRVSRKTTLYRIGDGSRQWLLVESDDQTQLTGASVAVLDRSAS